MGGNGFKSNLRKNFKGIRKTWNKFLKTAVNVAAPFIGIAVIAKTKTPKVVQATKFILEAKSGAKIVLLSNIQGIHLRLGDM